MNTSGQINEVSAALAKAQGAMQNPTKDVINPHFKSHYTDIAGGLNAIRESMSANGLAIVQATQMDGDFMMLITRICHSSGQWIESIYPVCKFPLTSQQAGSALTYARRYSLFALVGIAGEDDDGNDASEEPTPAPYRKPAQKPADDIPFADVQYISHAQMTDLSRMIAETKTEIDKFMAYFRIKELGHLQRGDYLKAVEMLNKKAAP